MIKRARGSLSEFGPALIIFFVIILFPLLDLLSYADGVATLSFAAQSAARAAGPATTRKAAQEAMRRTGEQIIGAGGNPAPLAAFAKITPFDNSGLTLTVVEIGNDGQVKGTFAYGANVPDADITSGANFFQYQVTASYNVGMMWPIPMMPSSIPMTFTSSTLVEHPEGLNSMD